MSQLHFIVFANEKGGTGKSTTAVHVAIALAAKGARVALLDIDETAAAEVAAGALGVMPPAPPRFSTTMGWPSRAASAAVVMRSAPGCSSMVARA